MLKKILIGLFALVFVSLAGLLIALYQAPAIAIYFANNWYQQQGENYQLSVENWRFKPWKTSLELQNLELTHPGIGAGKTQLASLELDFDFKALLQNHLLVHKLSLADSNLSLALVEQNSGNQLEIAGLQLDLSAQTEAEIAEAEVSESSASWQVDLNQLQLTNIQLSWNVALENLPIAQDAAPKSEQNATENSLVTQGSLLLETVSLENFGLDDLAEPTLQLRAQLQEFQLRQTQLVAQEDSSKPQLITLDLSLQKSLQIATQGKLTQLITRPGYVATSLQLADFGLQLQAGKLAQLDLQFAGLQLANLLLNAEQQTLESVELTGFQLQTPELKLDLAQLDLEKIDYQNNQLSLAELQIQQLNFSQVETEIVASLAKIQINDISYFDETAKVASLNLEDLSFSQAEIEAGLQTLTAKNLAAETENYQLASFAGQGLQLDLQINSDSADSEKQATKQTTEQIKIQLQDFAGTEFNYQPENLSWQTFNLQQLQTRLRDRSVKPALWLNLEIEKLLAGAANLRFTDGDFALTDKLPLEIAAKINQRATANLTANISLLTDQATQKIYPEGDADLQIKSLDLVSFNGYLIEHLGYQLEIGSLDADLQIQVENQQLGGELKLLLRNSKLVPTDQERISRISKQITMPLDIALGLLRDKNGNLRLSVPIEGDIQDPSFKATDALRQLRNKALQQGSLFMLKQSLQPFSTMISVASFAGEYAFAIRLDPLDFAEQSVDLNEQHQQNLQKIAELLTSKSKLELSVCPFVSAAEIASLPANTSWERLARQRGNQVKNWFDQQAPEITDRVTVCMPQQGKKPQVMLGIQ